MKHELLRPGGRYNVRRTGPDEYTLSLPLPTDRHGMTARECPAPACAPGYFKIKLGTGIQEPGYDRCYCPYCRREGNQGDFLTREQRRYAESVIARETEAGVQRMMKDALDLDSRGRRRMDAGLFSIEVTMKSSPSPPPLMPYEEQLRRDVVCPHCALAHAVFGLAVWCADCGRDIFLTHLVAELEVVRKVLGEVEGRRERLGSRVAARDIENALEDTVSIFEAVMKFIYRRRLAQTHGAEEAEKRLARHHSAFQNPERAQQIAREELGVHLFEGVDPEGQRALGSTFQKRHTITHNLGVVDGRYLEKGGGTGGLGREVRLTATDVSKVLDLVEQVLGNLYTKLVTV